MSRCQDFCFCVTGVMYVYIHCVPIIMELMVNDAFPEADFIVVIRPRWNC